MSKLLLCCDCAHFVPNLEFCKGGTNAYDPLYGEKHNEYVSASRARQHEIYCGKDARWFKVKEPK